MDSGLRCFEQLRAMDDMNNFVSLAQTSKCYQWIRVVDEMNDSGL